MHALEAVSFERELIPDNRRHSTAGFSENVIYSGGNKFSNVRSFLVQFDLERAKPPSIKIIVLRLLMKRKWAMKLSEVY